MQGKIAVRVKEDIRVTNYYLKSTTNGAKEINSEYKKKSIMTNISLPNIDSTIAYQGEITNIGTFAMVLDSISDLVRDNENIVYDLVDIFNRSNNYSIKQKILNCLKNHYKNFIYG